MPPFNVYKDRLGSYTDGQARKIESDKLMEWTWWEDIAARRAYLCDWYHDSEQLVLNNLHPELDPLKIPIDIKFVQSSSQTYDKDQVTVHLQLKPSQECNVPYYKEFFEERYNSMFPIGLYAIIQDDKGIWNRWLIVDKANVNVTQFPTFEILRCDYVFQYIMDNQKIQIPGVLRSQNSYNSGIWTDYKITVQEDQQKFAVPLNRDTEKIYYREDSDNLRMIIDNKVLTEPRCWKVTKVNRITPNGISRITLAQDSFDQHKDYIELDDNGNVIGMWADYYKSSIPPIDSSEKPIKTIYGKFTYSGQSQLCVDGGYKTYTLNFYDDDELIEFKNGDYAFVIGESPIDEGLIKTIIKDNTIKVKFLGDLKWINSIITMTHTTEDGVKTSVDVEIIGL